MNGRDDRNAVALTPVNLLTGFLGSGKTTLLQRLLDDPAMAGAAVLVNEFGQVGLDHHLLERIDDNVVLMKSGCICCTVRGEIADSLLDLYGRRSRGEISWFDRVVIETTGMADPFPALSTIRSHPVLKSHFAIGNVVTTVDAVNTTHSVAHRREAVRQIGAADILVVTKTDLSSAASAEALETLLARINPTARIAPSTDPEIAGLIAAASSSYAMDGHDGIEESSAGRSHNHQEGHHHHHDDEDEHAIRSFALTYDRRVDWTGFGIWLTMLLNRHGDRIFRVKGILNVEGEDNPVAIHAVQRLVHPPVHMKAWPDGSRHSHIVFIAEGIAPESIRRSWEVFSGLSARILEYDLEPVSRDDVVPMAMEPTN